MTPIEHFLIDIIQIIFRDIIEITIADIGHCKAATDIFQPTLRNFFYKRWPIIFFYGRRCVFVRYCRKNLEFRSARFFRSSSTEVVFRLTPACFHLLGRENISYPRTKNYDSPLLIKRNASRRRSGKMTDRGLKKERHRMTPMEHFLIDIIQIIFRDWIERRMADFCCCKAATDIFQSTLSNFFTNAGR